MIPSLCVLLACGECFACLMRMLAGCSHAWRVSVIHLFVERFCLTVMPIYSVKYTRPSDEKLRYCQAGRHGGKGRGRGRQIDLTVREREKTDRERGK